jgi:hypothetical protein
VLIGCGALGSMAAECIVRSGAPDVALFDQDKFEMGNQYRHTLDGSEVGRYKAIALAQRLQSCNPLSRVRGYPVAMPLPKGDSELEKESNSVLERASLIIDCTANESAFLWMSQYCRSNRIRLASLYFNFDATILTIAMSGRTTSCAVVCRRLYADIEAGNTPITREAHSAAPNSEALVIPGAGCWHSTFPATNSSVWMLAVAGIQVLEQMLVQPLTTDGAGVLIRRNKIETDVPPRSILETVWSKRYR